MESSSPPVCIGVGIDTARFGHHASFLNEQRKTAAPPLIIMETREGYDKFQKQLENLQKRYPTVNFHVRIDAGGQYAANLEHYIRSLPLPITLSIGEPKRNKDYCGDHLLTGASLGVLLFVARSFFVYLFVVLLWLLPGVMLFAERLIGLPDGEHQVQQLSHAMPHGDIASRTTFAEACVQGAHRGIALNGRERGIPQIATYQVVSLLAHLSLAKWVWFPITIDP